MALTWALTLVLGVPYCCGIFAGSDFNENTHTRTPIARRELESSRKPRRKRPSEHDGIALEPHGEFIKLGTQQKRDAQHRKLTAQDRLDFKDCGLNSSKPCAIVYVLGEVNSTNCSDPSNEILVEDIDQCHRAGDSAGVDHNETFWWITGGYKDIRPKGCSAYPCNRDPNGVCYFFNTIGDSPQGAVTGRPVCMRQTFVTGEENMNGGCPTGYDDIMDNVTCVDYADCRQHCKGPVMDVTLYNYSQHHEFPAGCFLWTAYDGCVYFNPHDDVTPLRPKGMPVCVSDTIQGLTRSNIWTYTGR